MNISIEPVKNQHQVRVTCSENGDVTYYTCSTEISIGRVIKHAVETFYKEQGHKRLASLFGNSEY